LQTDGPDVLDDATVDAVLTHGELELEGRLVSASNASFLGTVTLDGVALSCVYKPVAGERPLWDFPGGTLAGREVAARLVSEAGGFGVVPPTVLRDGRFGVGMCQRWVHVDPDADLVDIVPPDFDDPGWIAVMEAEDRREQPVLLVHADDDRLRDMALLDVVINNADRKGGHVLVEPEPSGRVWGCDHGVCFHEEPKLRTVLWGWAGEPLRDKDKAMLDELGRRCRTGFDAELEQHLSRVEVDAMRYRVDQLDIAGVMPTPGDRWPVIPWPAF
jgi:uncharacterized repeat protein (TIGR03843 family)